MSSKSHFVEEIKCSNEEVNARAKSLCIVEVFARLLLPPEHLSAGRA